MKMLPRRQIEYSLDKRVATIIQDEKEKLFDPCDQPGLGCNATRWKFLLLKFICHQQGKRLANRGSKVFQAFFVKLTSVYQRRCINHGNGQETTLYHRDIRYTTAAHSSGGRAANGASPSFLRLDSFHRDVELTGIGQFGCVFNRQ